MTSPQIIKMMLRVWALVSSRLSVFFPFSNWVPFFIFVWFCFLLFSDLRFMYFWLRKCVESSQWKLEFAALFRSKPFNLGEPRNLFCNPTWCYLDLAARCILLHWRTLMHSSLESLEKTSWRKSLSSWAQLTWPNFSRLECGWLLIGMRSRGYFPGANLWCLKLLLIQEAKFIVFLCFSAGDVSQYGLCTRCIDSRFRQTWKGG